MEGVSRGGLGRGLRSPVEAQTREGARGSGRQSLSFDTRHGFFRYVRPTSKHNLGKNALCTRDGVNVC